MESNIPVWSYYQPGFVHPEFVPYLRYPVKDDQGNTIYINTWEDQGYANGLVNPYIVRKNWGMAFARKHEDDPCPPGFIPGEGGYCFPYQPENEAIFYTKKAFIPKRQYWKSYVDDSRAPQRVSESFDMRSVHPMTGEYVVYYEGCNDRPYGGMNKTPATNTRYGRNPTKDSYLA